MRKVFTYILLFFFSGAPLILISKSLFLIDPPIWPDEPVFLDMAQNLLISGKPSAHIIGNIIPEVDLTGFGYPPLYFLILGIWTGILGTGIETVRSLSLLLGLASLFVFFLIGKNLFHSSKLATIGTFILALNAPFSRSSRLGRMEILVIFLLLLSFLLLLQAQRKNNLKFTFLGGITAGLAVLVHPLGFIAPVIFILGSSVSFFGLKKNFSALVLALIPTLFFLFFWLIYINGDIGPLIRTYQAQLADKSGKEIFIFTLFTTNLLWKALLIFYALISTLFVFNLRKSFTRTKLILFMALIVSFSFSLLGKENSYFVFTQPFIILALVFLISYWIKKGEDITKFAAGLLCAAIIFIHLGLLLLVNDNILPGKNTAIPFWHFNRYDYHQLTKEIIDALPRNQKINIYLNSAPDPYFDLLPYPEFTLYEGTILPASDNAFRKLWDSMDYMVVTWIPQQLLADYINRNSEEIITVGRNTGYTVLVIKLQPKEKRL